MIGEVGSRYRTVKDEQSGIFGAVLAEFILQGGEWGEARCYVDDKPALGRPVIDGGGGGAVGFGVQNAKIPPHLGQPRCVGEGGGGGGGRWGGRRRGGRGEDFCLEFFGELAVDVGEVVDDQVVAGAASEAFDRQGGFRYGYDAGADRSAKNVGDVAFDGGRQGGGAERW